ncbi:tRNA-specific adenosine deaminase [Saccharopolyspora subtropica]|uniref:Nucleoside deaminase n=1 Tax=Saccharopolyspora thermophila TaxID=89367 RepID=A0A917JM81_9PSEU|nr:nucleoside deaminase [Saccharopolyspora subtropica]GGI72441.1 tRNA-specific adenosine deaminase [Saccharopolyspora subtropica]
MSVDVATSAEQEWMARAIELATTNVDSGGGPFGALVVRDGEVVATGTNRVTVDLDPTAHAEVTAIRNACRALGTFKLDGCVLVTSCEPCPMCLASALWARLDRVLFAADRDDAAAAGFDDRAFYEVFRDPEASTPTPVHRVEMPNRNAAFDAWRTKPDRVAY